MKKILIFKLSKKEKDLIAKASENYDVLTCEDVLSMDLLLGHSPDNVFSCFICLDNSVELSALELLLKKYAAVPIHIVLKDKNFDKLMLCYRYSVCSVFDGKFSLTELENALLKANLIMNNNDKKVPVQEVMLLFTRPLKIKSNLDLYHRLSEYFESFEQVGQFGFAEVKGDEVSFLGSSFCSSVADQIKLQMFPEKYIGHEVVLNINEKNYVASPLYKDGNQKLWLILKIPQEAKNYILNKLFYKFLENVLIYRKNKKKESNLAALATMDDVTGLYNLRKLSVDLENAVKTHMENDQSFSIMFIDVDHFKRVNDLFGHVVGSKLLQNIGELLSHILRASDHIYRYGGDEFVVIMPQINIKVVHEIAARVLKKIKETNFKIDNEQTYNLSVSIGIAEYPTDAKSAIDIIKFADEMMYQSKDSGRGKVIHIKEVANVDTRLE